MNMPTLPRLAIVALCLAALTGCASVTRGSTNEVNFTSNPSGAKVTTSTGQSCTAPCSMIFERRQEFLATFTLNNETRTIDVVTDLAANGAGAAAGNILAGGVIGLGIDAATGATLDHYPDPVHADFNVPQAEQVQALPSTI